MNRGELNNLIRTESMIADSLNGECTLTLNLSIYVYSVNIGKVVLKRLENKDELNWLQDNIETVEQLTDRVSEYCEKTGKIPYIKTDF